MIRKLKREEIPIIAEGFEKFMREQFIKINEKPITKVEYEKILNKNIKTSNMLVLEEEKIKAFMWFIREKDEINLEEIFSFERAKGYGKQLLGFLLNYSKEEKIKRINIDVHFKNKNALTFFKKFGFTERTIELSLEL